MIEGWKRVRKAARVLVLIDAAAAAGMQFAPAPVTAALAAIR